MAKNIDPNADGLIIEPIEEAIAMYDELLKELCKFMVRIFLGTASSYKVTDAASKEIHRPEPKESRAVELATFYIGGNNEVSSIDKQMITIYSHVIKQDIFQGAGYRHFASLANRPAADSLAAFNQIIRKITQQSLNTHNAMLPHLIYKISNVREPPATSPDKLLDATPAMLFDVIRPRLQLGNDLHMTFSRVGRTTINGLERLKEQNEEWSKLWSNGLEQLEPRTVELGSSQVKNAILNLEKTMMGCLRTIHTHHMKKGW
ncbi:unnamed protein product [Aureobasidium uvarum]|uniref:Uncharacterized protein n=1 Tax=Aureobasidium uvarum TaxID=2773716 RepID=A0A9N8KCU5_9PEZI|nr:unnamed protein product [Aureobasidium uvarum]